ncbi:MAG: Uma2 family endonuclease [Planctomycetaceae bacterium]
MSAGTPTVAQRDDDIDFTPPGPAMTLADFHALPDDPDVERMLIRGRLWEKPMTKRTRSHAFLESRVAYLLWTWAEQQPAPRPRVYSGEIGCDLPGLETGLGIDVAVVSAELEATLSEREKYIVGAPTLVVEILSPSDRVEEINAKLDDYLAAGVPLIWIVDPFRRTIVQHRPNAEPEMFTGKDEISCDPHLSGFRMTVGDLFGR